MDNKALNDALTAGVKEALGSLQFLVISLQSEKSVLAAQNSSLAEKVAALEVYGEVAKEAYDTAKSPESVT